MSNPSTRRSGAAALPLLALALLAFNTKSALAAEYVPVWAYNPSPPFVLDQELETGLSYDLAKLLSERSKGQYSFEIEVLPRPRLDLNLSNNEPGVVFWVNNNWFGDPDKIKFLWSDTLIEGSASVLSPTANPVEFDGAESLIGMDLVGVRGHVYGPVDPLVEAGEISRKDVNSEESLIHFIASERAEVAIVAFSAAGYYIKDLGVEDKVHYSAKPHSEFNRYALVTSPLKHVLEYMDPVVNGFENDAEWQGLLEKYGLK